MSQDYSIINIVGIDGAGKSTLSKNLVNVFREKNINSKYIYCQFFPKLLYPFKLIAKQTVLKNHNEFLDYESYIQRKTNFSKKNKLLSSIYALIWLVDYSIQVFLKVNRALKKNKVFVIDRYIYDIAINISLMAGWSMEKTNKIIDLFFRIHPKPDIVIFIDLPEEVAFSRKDDIQSISYLRDRRKCYLWLSKKRNFEVVDGLGKKENILAKTLNKCSVILEYEN